MNNLIHFKGKLFKKTNCLALILLCTCHFSNAQSTSLEFWPEANIWYKVSPSFRYSVFTPITKYCESKERDLNIYLHADYLFGKTKTAVMRRMFDDNRIQQMKAWVLRVGIMGGRSLEDWGEDYTEEMAFGELHRRIPIVGNLLLSHRIRTEFRWLGQDLDYSYRIRYRVILEKDFTFTRSSLVPYVNIEPYWDSRYQQVNRVRAIAGLTYARSTRYAIESNMTYQYDAKMDVTHTYALNLILHLYFESKKYKQILTN